MLWIGFGHLLWSSKENPGKAGREKWSINKSA
jgi:hypothetical protein